jgi:hypothetical protein
MNERRIEMNTKRNNLMIVATVAIVLSATPVFAHLEYFYTPAGVWIPKPDSYTPEAMKATSESKGFDLFAGLGKAVIGLPKAVGNLLDEIFASNEQKSSMEMSKAVKYRDIQNASGVIVRIPER